MTFLSLRLSPSSDVWVLVLKKKTHPQAKLLLRMLAYMSETIKEAFMVDELRARIAQMLGYFLDHLVGKKSKGLKVSLCPPFVVFFCITCGWDVD